MTADRTEYQTTLQAIRSGDDEAKQVLLDQYTPLVIKIAAGLTGRYIERGRDEEISIGLMALNEAIDKYDPSRGASFASFANLVISNRLRDYLRRRKCQELPASAVAQQLLPLDSRRAWLEYREREVQENRRCEVQQYIQQLAAYNLDLKALAAATPKHRQARLRAMQAARLLADNPALRKHVETRKELPLKELETMLSVSRKTLERQRKYIIGLFIILTGDYQYLSEYLPGEAGAE